MEILQEYSGNTECTKIARDIVVTMQRFSFLFGAIGSERFFSINDVLSKAFQKNTICASEAKTMAAICISCLRTRSEDCFEKSLERG